MNRKQQTIVILILGALSTVSPFAIDMYLPGFPAIAEDLSTSIASVQLSLTSYFIGIAAGQLLYGPMLDRYGRKVPLYIGLGIYILASIGCALTVSINALIAMRFLQAVGGCAGMVAAQTLVRDLFPLNKTAQAFSWITLVVAVSPLIAPSVGGFVIASYGWHAVFIILAVITTLISVAVYFFLPRGRKPDPSISLKPASVVANFLTVLKQRQFITYAVAGGLATSAPFAYIAGSAYVFMNIYHTTEKQYGLIFALVGGVIISSTQLNHFFLKRFKSEAIVRAALIYQLIMGLVLATGAGLGWFNMTGLIIFICLFLAGHGLTNPNAMALSLAPFSRHTGSAASLLGSFRMAMGGLVSALVSAFHNETQMPMIIAMVLCVAGGFVALILGKTAIRYHARREDVEKETVVI
jgi:DHA1 family bicyclomycin/chloramphenicol resistance-like MFS transporter